MQSVWMGFGYFNDLFRRVSTSSTHCNGTMLQGPPYEINSENYPLLACLLAQFLAACSLERLLIFSLPVKAQYDGAYKRKLTVYNI